jgi:uncharacterized membrane protein YesL
MSGFFGLGNYSKAGAGIAKGVTKSRTKLFFEILGVRVWNLFKLNLIYVLLCLPIITIGPATAGLIKVTRNYAADKNAFIWGDFWETFKKNFNKAGVMGIVSIIAYAGLFTGFYIYPVIISSESMAGSRTFYYALFILTISVAMTFTIMNYYIYIMMVSTDLPMKSIIKNSLILSYSAPKQNAVAFLSHILLSVLMIYLLEHNLLTLFILPFFPAAFIAFIVCFMCYPVVQKFVIAPYYEETGEKNPECPDAPSPDEVLFEDMGGKEKPVDLGKKKKGKGKIIS